MLRRIGRISLISIIVSAWFLGASFNFAQAATSLDGRILLQVQDKGQAWYVNPLNSKRYYLGRPDDAYSLMRALGLGVSNTDINYFLARQAPSRLSGRILLKVQDKGQAYYVSPLDLKLYYLGRPSDAFNLMRQKGLGITNNDLLKIPEGFLVISTALDSHRYTFKYQNISREFFLNLSPQLFNSYTNSPKTFYYTINEKPADVREAFYGLFLKLKSGDTSIDEIINTSRAIASQNNWSEDQLAEFVLALVQYIPYDSAKVVSGSNTNPYYPYETLYLNKGVCSDKTFLAVVLLRKLGYGAAILDFPDINHTAAGISCPLELSLNNSGYCYVETTNYFPPSVIPQSIDGQAQTATSDFANLFNPTVLGKIEIKQATTGKVYQGAAAVRAEVERLRLLKEDLHLRQLEIDSLGANLTASEASLNALKAQMDNYYNSGQISQYNALVPTYNTQANQYNAEVASYRLRVDEYNQKVQDFNQGIKNFYQQ